MKTLFLNGYRNKTQRNSMAVAIDKFRLPMNGKCILLLFLILLRFSGVGAKAQDFTITLDRDAKLGWVDENFQSSSYTVEGSNDLKTWYVDWESLSKILPASAVTTVRLPLFYRVVKKPRVTPDSTILPPSSIVGYQLHFLDLWVDNYTDATTGSENDGEDSEAIFHLFNRINDQSAVLSNTGVGGDETWTDTYVFTFQTATSGTFLYSAVDDDDWRRELRGTFTLQNKKNCSGKRGGRE
ncbi:MAG TPA: hypothetical protein EYG38_20440 [Verrucomicrobia bacterium]|nr:hypothetical protein [Verrucomicrobiota bacterium]